MNGDDLDLHDDFDDAPVARAWQPHPWWAWYLSVVALGILVLLGAGVALSNAEFGTSLRARGCDVSPLGGLALLVAGSLITVVGMQLARLQHHSAVVGIEWRGLAFAVPLPLVLLLATLPGVLGCSLGQDLSTIALFGATLVGTPGLMLAATSATLVGVALGSAVHVTWLAPVTGTVDDTPSMVELAMQEAEALQTDAASQRFHGVD